MAGRGRGVASGVAGLEQKEEQQRGEASRTGSGPDDQHTVRGRGGYRSSELNTIPANCKNVTADLEKTSRSIEVLSNFVRLSSMTQREIFQYRVDFEPVIESSPLRRVLVRLAFGKVFESSYTFDGVSDLRSSQKLKDKVQTQSAQHPNDASIQVQVTIKNVGIVDWSSFEMIRLYNMHTKDILRSLGFYRISNLGAYVNPEISTPVGPNLNILRGFRVAANVHMDNKIFMSLESVHKIMQTKNLLEVMSASVRGPDFKADLRASLVGKLVVTSYNKRVYKIEDINFDMSPSSTFRDERANTDISYFQYYEQRYGIKIVDKKQPLVLAVPNDKKRGDRDVKEKDIYLVPETCNIAGLTDQQRNDNRLKVDMIRASQVPPKDRVQHMNKFLSQLHSNRNVTQMLNNWGYSYDKQAVAIKARILTTESIGIGQAASGPADKWAKVDQQGSFDNLITRDSLAKPPEFKKMAVLIPKPVANSEAEILNKLQTGFSKIRLSPGDVELVRMIQGDSAHHYVQYLKNLSPEITAALVLLPHQNKERYDAVKKLASCERGLITQVITAKLMTDARKASGAALKIGIQVAAKIGGEPWYLNIPLRGAMVCGYDTYHDTANRGRSFGAFVASMNDRYSRWFSKADSHDKSDELSSHLTENFVLALRKYKDLNGRYPDRAFIYRDGVSDGQIEHVFKVELEQVRRAARDCDTQIRLTVIIVNKRIGARFYMRTGDTFANCPPGTVVDDVVTRKERFDFYLISQSTRAGTVSPTYYNIVHDESGLTAAHHQAMAYKFCFLYYNWTGSVRVPAPCQYAHKLALLCGEHLHQLPSSSLDDRLHFL